MKAGSGQGAQQGGGKGNLEKSLTDGSGDSHTNG